MIGGCFVSFLFVAVVIFFAGMYYSVMVWTVGIVVSWVWVAICDKGFFICCDGSGGFGYGDIVLLFSLLI